MTSDTLTPLPNDAWFGRAISAGQSAWPALTVDPRAFADFLRARAVLGDIGSSLASDLYLACACACGVAGAVSALLDVHHSTIAAAAATFDASPAFLDEVKQRLAEVLFVDHDGEPGRISQYGGQGPLGAWLATASRRIALRLAKANATGKFVGEEALANRFATATDPDLAMLRGRFKPMFNGAIVTALRRLSSRERLILRLNMVEGISMERIAKMHGVSQPTISRWLQQARVAILNTVRDLVRDELAVNDGEFDSLLRALRSQVDLSFSRIFGEVRDREPDGRAAVDEPPGDKSK